MVKKEQKENKLGCRWVGCLSRFILRKHIHPVLFLLALWCLIFARRDRFNARSFCLKFFNKKKFWTADKTLKTQRRKSVLISFQLFRTFLAVTNLVISKSLFMVYAPSISTEKFYDRTSRNCYICMFHHECLLTVRQYKLIRTLLNGKTT